MVSGTKELEGIRVEGDTLVIRMKLDKKGVLSSTGKSFIVASTGGFKAIEGTDLRVNLTAIRK